MTGQIMWDFVGHREDSLEMELQQGSEQARALILGVHSLLGVESQGGGGGGHI